VADLREEDAATPKGELLQDKGRPSTTTRQYSMCSTECYATPLPSSAR